MKCPFDGPFRVVIEDWTPSKDQKQRRDEPWKTGQVWLSIKPKDGDSIIGMNMQIFGERGRKECIREYRWLCSALNEKFKRGKKV
jgi:hypothetical protein